MAGTAARTLAFAAESFARSLKPRYDGTAIASRMPMMTMTTRSSMRVKPLSSRARRCRKRAIQISPLNKDEEEVPGQHRHRLRPELAPFEGSRAELITQIE